MKTTILKTILVMLTCIIYANANAQQVAFPTGKDYVLNESTKKYLPKGFTYEKGKVVPQKGYKLVYLEKYDKTILVSAKKNSGSGALECTCNGAGSCAPSSGPIARCSGDCTDCVTRLRVYSVPYNLNTLTQ
jgi:hypothetical protein